ncbi:MAG: hypothetical protein FRX48_09124 [Lasallia pustulata]|uniref:Uncharacterized protein n=1 Tax=Lasallia pustulata TaxID=136370 RepID=A0A5M8PDQ4_9LECA|nr:MAG: hypothetical protein FRX48_09124 [Lasallia pustulata]
MAVPVSPQVESPEIKGASAKSSTGTQAPSAKEASGAPAQEGHGPVEDAVADEEAPSVEKTSGTPPEEGHGPVEDVVEEEEILLDYELSPPQTPARLTRGQVDMIMDPDMLALSNQLEAIGIQSAAPACSKLVETPRGYKLQMETDPQWFFEKRNEWRKSEKRKRSFGVPDLGRNRKYGFTPEELHWTGALDLEDAKPSNLDNEIHPLLSHDNFDDCPQEIYDQLMPACRLATMFLTKDVCMQYWVTVAMGKREVDIGPTISAGGIQERIREDVPMTAANIAHVRQYMTDLQQKENPIHFIFHDALPTQNTFAAANSVCDYNFKHRMHPKRKFRHSQIYLNRDYYTAAQKLGQLQYPDEAQRLRFNFLLANTLVHELAHAVQMGHVNERTAGREVFLYDARRNELGEAWEAKTWGGRVLPINSRCDGINGVAVCDWPFKNVFYDPEHEHNIWYSVPMGFIENIQQKKTWRKDYPLDDQPFRIPKTGAQSTEIVAFTTMKMSEEERVRNEEMEEAKRAEREEEEAQPAKKRAMTGTGEARREGASDDIFGPNPPPKGPRFPVTPPKGPRYPLPPSGRGRSPVGRGRGARGRGLEGGPGV